MCVNMEKAKLPAFLHYSPVGQNLNILLMLLRKTMTFTGQDLMIGFD